MNKKKCSLVMLGLLLCMLFAVPARAADVRYVDADKIYAHKKKDTNSKALRTLWGGDKILIERDEGYWVAILCDTGNGQTLGWVRSKYLTYTMPQKYCKHNWTGWETVYSPTCTSTGLKERSCRICGLGQAKDIPKLGHEFGSWYVTKEATCMSEGKRMHRCVRCGKDEYQTLKKLPHSYSSWIILRAASCSAEGERSRRCQVCGHVQKDIIDRLPHSYGSWSIRKEASCSEEGARVRVCSVCGHQDIQSIAKLPHDLYWKVLSDPTDHSQGIRVQVCRVCGYTQNRESFDPLGTIRRGDRGEEVAQMQQNLIDMNYLGPGGADGIFGAGTEKALAQFQADNGLTADGIGWPQTLRMLRHTYGPWRVIKKATRSEDGERVRVCTDCGYEQHEAVPASPRLEYGRRNEDVRALQQVSKMIGYDAGKYDGIYGQQLEYAYAAYAKDHNMPYRAGLIYPAVIDAMLNDWIATIPDAEWKGEGTAESAVNLVLSVDPVDGEDDGDLETYKWSLTNMGSESCIFTALLMNFDSSPNFRKGNFVVVLDGEEVLAGCGNTLSGTFQASRDWGEGEADFCALAVSEATGVKWLSNHVR